MSFASYHRLCNWVPNQSLDKILVSNGTKCKKTNLNSHDIYENMRNKRKMEEKIRRVCTILPKCKLLTFLDYQTCYQIKVEKLHFNPIV